MKKDIRKILGANVKKLRKSKGLSQVDFAKEVSLQPQAISQIENGKVYPALKTLDKICIRFKISPGALFSTAKEVSNDSADDRESLLGAINMIISEMTDDKLEILVSIMATLAEESVKIQIKK